jgi:hypothetical protein
MTKKVITMILGLCLPTMVLAAEGGHIGGGDHKAQAFTKIARDAADQIAAKPGLVQIDLTAFRNAIDSTEVEFTDDELVINGISKDAVNIRQQKKIRVNKSRWSSISARAQSALAVHEYLGILGLEDLNYNISYKLLNMTVEKFTCLVYLYGQSLSQENGTLSAKVDVLTGPKHNLKVEQDNDENLSAIKVTWDLRDRYDNQIRDFNRLKYTKIFIKSTKYSETLQFDVYFGDWFKKITSQGNTSFINLSFLDGKRSLSAGKVYSDTPFPNVTLATSTPGNKRQAFVRCTVE